MIGKQPDRHGTNFGVGKRQYARIINVSAAAPYEQCSSNGIDAYKVIAVYNWLVAMAAPGSTVNASFAPPHCEDSLQMMKNAEVRAYWAGITTVQGAGNDNCLLPTSVEIKDVGPSGPMASIVNVIAVGATDITNARWTSTDYSSNYGPAIDVWAPGKAIDMMDGNGVWTVGSGTSYATPMVSGTLAVLCQISNYCVMTKGGTDPTKYGDAMEKHYNRIRGWEICTGTPATPPPNLPSAMCPTLHVFASPNNVVTGIPITTPIATTKRFMRIPPEL